MHLVALVRHALRPLRYFAALLFGLLRRPHPLAPFFFLLQMLALVALAELAPVNTRPLLVDRTKLLMPQMEFAPVGVARRDVDMHVRVIGVSVDGGDEARPRQTLREVAVDHLFGLVVAHLLVEGINQAVMRARLAVPALRPG